MKKVILVGKLNDVLKDVNQALLNHFFVQVCDLRTELIEGMMKVVDPDICIISLVGAQDYDNAIFTHISAFYPDIPVITIGTEREMQGFLRFYSDGQFENLTRPVKNEIILEAVCKRLDLEYSPERGVVDKKAKKNIMVVDDSAIVLRAVKAMLEDEFEVTAANSGTQAITKIGKKRPDLVLLDYEMPVCDGRQTLEMIRSEEGIKNLPVVFLTAHSDRKHINAVLGLKPAGYLLKPPVKENLIVTIKKILGMPLDEPEENEG
ncbi:MAG: response regulator [Lachnospiraceae bacterium]|nr:response regulator [Lachnospiraceae bacterium]